MLLINAKLGGKIKCCQSGFLTYNFAAHFQKSARLLLWKKEKFRTISACTAVLQNCKNPLRYISGCFKALSCDWGWHLLRTCSWCVLCWSLSCSSLHIFNPIILLRQAALCDQSLYTYRLSDPHWSRLSVWSRILSLTQTAALLQSSVVHFVVAVKSFPSTVALFILFSVFPQRK